MKKLSALLALLLLTSTCFGADTNLGKLELTQTQIENSALGVKPDPFKGFSFSSAGVIGVSDVSPTDQQILDAVSWLVNQPTEKSQDLAKDQFDVLIFQSGLLGLLPVISNIGLRLEFGALNTFAQNKDFDGISQYLGFLEANGIATSEDVAYVKAVVAEQGVILQ
jgi:hypothetical protein